MRVRTQALKHIPAKCLRPDAHNFRIHTAKQKAALTSVLDTVGFVGAILVRPISKTEFAVIDGHERLTRFLPDDNVPCLVLDITEDEARKLLATFDELGRMSGKDTERLNELFASLADTFPDLEKLGDELLAAADLATSDDAVPGAATDDEPPAPKSKRKGKPAHEPADFRVIVHCETEAQQADMIERLLADGYECTAAAA